MNSQQNPDANVELDPDSIMELDSIVNNEPNDTRISRTAIPADREEMHKEIGWNGRFLQNRRRLKLFSQKKRKKFSKPYVERLSKFMEQEKAKRKAKLKMKRNDSRLEYTITGIEARMKQNPIERSIPLETFRTVLDEMYVKNLYSINQCARNLNQNNYHLGRLIDIGRTSYVYELFGKNNQLFAIKIIDFQWIPTDLSQQILQNEFNVLTNSKHSNIVQLHSYFFQPDLYLAFVMEYAPTNLLLWCSTSQDPDDMNRSRYWSYGINKALIYLHSLGYAHRDLRASDVLLWPDGQIKISDFTHAKYCINPKTNQPIMMERTTDDLQYTAPELFYTSFLNNMEGMDPFKGDCFAFGVLLYMICFRKYPFGRFRVMYSNMEKRKFLRNIRRNRWLFTLNQNEHCSLYELLKGLLTPHSAQRISMLDALASPWYREDAHPNLVQDIAINVQFYSNGGKGMPNRIFLNNNQPVPVRSDQSQFKLTNESKFQPAISISEENWQQIHNQYRRPIRSKELDENDDDYARYVRRNQNLIDFETFKQQFQIQTKFPPGISSPRPQYHSLPRVQPAQRQLNVNLNEEDDSTE